LLLLLLFLQWLGRWGRWGRWKEDERDRPEGRLLLRLLMLLLAEVSLLLLLLLLLGLLVQFSVPVGNILELLLFILQLQHFLVQIRYHVISHRSRHERCQVAHRLFFFLLSLLSFPSLSFLFPCTLVLGPVSAFLTDEIFTQDGIESSRF
jgi:hypothetical protein